jgi:hypothetical protein
MENIQKETKEYVEKEPKDSNEPNEEKRDLSDPKGEGLGNLGDMFKNFEKIAKEQEQKGETPGAAPETTPGSTG